uniref:Uncharacterized protein n=1 Tax=Pygocentrus nattereri TaxID=42514 RepID=A0AAR2JV89_PYGNA
MPISRHCHPQVIKQYNFRWIPKGMIYLGIKLTSELGEMATLNFEPLLQNIKTNLGKWGKLNLKMGTFLHLIWECPLVEPFWHSVLKFLETWAGVALPVSPHDIFPDKCKWRTTCADTNIRTSPLLARRVAAHLATKLARRPRWMNKLNNKLV